MANVRNNNTFYVDASSSSGDASSYVSDKNMKVVGIVFYGNATTDIVDIYDKDASSAAQGAHKFSLMAGTAKDVRQIRLEGCPVVCPNGIWVTLTGSPKATLILQGQGGGST